MEIKNWSEQERLEFLNQEFDQIFLNNCIAKPHPDNFDFNAELYFENCKIKSFGLVMVYTVGRIEFNNCSFEEINCIAPMFAGGFVMRNCRVEGEAIFDAGAHNRAPNKFIIDSCMFKDYVDFFDVQFDGPVKISNNKFLKGSNLCIYLAPPLGILAGQEVLIENNTGDLFLYREDDPMKPKTKPNN
jgi:hypothetical protein